MAVVATPATAEYRQIAPGHTLEYATAFCENAAMEQKRGGILFNPMNPSAGFLIGGGGLGYFPRKRYQANCMIMLGWKWFADEPVTHSRPTNQSPPASWGCGREQRRTATWEQNC